MSRRKSSTTSQIKQQPNITERNRCQKKSPIRKSESKRDSPQKPADYLPTLPLLKYLASESNDSPKQCAKINEAQFTKAAVSVPSTYVQFSNQNRLLRIVPHKLITCYKNEIPPTYPNLSQVLPSIVHNNETFLEKERNSRPRPMSADVLGKKIGTPLMKLKTISDTTLDRSKTNSSSTPKDVKGKLNRKQLKYKLKKELEIIKNQLLQLTEKDGPFMQKNELEDKYKNLVEINKRQEEELVKLKKENMMLFEKLNKCKQSEGDWQEANADELSALYNEFVLSTHLIHQAKKKIYNSILEKKDFYKDLLQTNKNLSMEIKEKDNQIKVIEAKCKKLQEHVNQLEQENQEIKENYSNIQTKLDDNLKEVNTIIKEKESFQSKINEWNEEKQQLLKELSEAARFTEDFDNLYEEVKDLQIKNEDLVERHAALLLQIERGGNIEISNMKVLTEQLKELSQKQTELIQENERIRSFSETLVETLKENENLLAELDNCIDDKDFMIRSQTNELQTKDRQLKLALQSAEKLRKVVDLGKTDLKVDDEIAALATELSDLILNLYEEQQQLNQKEEVIRSQHKKISYLESTLTKKDEECSKLRNKLGKPPSIELSSTYTANTTETSVYSSSV